jgi:hypothetical protein
MNTTVAGSRGLRRLRLAVWGAGVALGLGCWAGSPAALGADNCPNAAVRAQQNSTYLPDCRAYELVNPATDDIGEVNRVPLISDDGETVLYTSVILGNSALGGGVSSLSVARRGADGWSRVSADPFSYGALWQGTGLTEAIVFSKDFTKGLLNTSIRASASDEDTRSDLYRVDVGHGTTTLMSPSLATFPYSVLGATDSLDRVVFDVVSSGAQSGIYANEGGPDSQLLSVDQNGAQVGGAVRAGTGADRGMDVGVGSGSHQPFVERGGSHAVSADTQRVYFYSSVGFYPDIGLAGPLLLNDHGVSRVVSASQRTGDVGNAYNARFISATRDGGSVYFNSIDQLTDGATPGGGIYRYDVATRALTLLTPDAGSPAGLQLSGAIASDDQSHIYFTSSSDLAPGATAGDRNAYVWTQADGVRFIAAVGGDLFSRVTPDGRFALMLSNRSFGGASNDGRQAVYRYDAVTRQLICVSCRPDGAPSEGSADIESQSFGLPSAPMTHNRALTFDGDVVFTSTDRLTTNDQTNAQDVYMYHDGVLSLLTAGEGDSGSYVSEVSDDGKNVLIVSRSRLVGADRDAQEADVYDVRVGGGFLEPPAPPAPCRGDDCQGPALAAPAAASPGTSRVSGPGKAPASKVARTISVSALTASQRSTLARTGRVAISVRVTGPGSISVRGRGRVAGRTTTVGSGRTVVLERSATTAKVTFRLTAAARRELSRKRRLSMSLQTRLSGVSRAVSSTVKLSAKGR